MSQLIHKCRKNHAILCDISCGTTCKKLHFTYLASSSIKQRRVSPLWFYHKLKFLYSMNKHRRSWLVLLQQLKLKLSFVKCHPLCNHPSSGWYARLPNYLGGIITRKKSPEY